eukprot:1355538-Amphidinium_carterae.2
MPLPNEKTVLAPCFKTLIFRSLRESDRSQQEQSKLVMTMESYMYLGLGSPMARLILGHSTN